MLLPGIYLAVATVVSVVLIEKGVKARDITMAGIAVFIASMWFLGHSTPMSNESDTQVAMNWRAVGIAAMMLPIMTASIMTLRGAEVGEGTALLGLSRQLGGSIGVAIAATQLTVMTQFHRYHLMDRISSGAPAFQDRMNLIAGALYTRGMSPDAARQGAAKIVDFQVSIQAYTMAVNNVYILTGIMLVIGVPFLFMMKRGRSDGVAVGH
jgi:DHA2 family multidrug resistance protein